MSVLARLRRFWLDVHLWLGVGLLIPFVLIGVTGSLLVWHDPLERQFEPQRYVTTDGPSLPLAAQLESARAAFGDAFAPTTVRAPEEAGDPIVVQARATARPVEGQRPETRTAWLDPATARVLDVANTRASAFGIMHVLHGSLMIPQNGRKIVGWIGWGMTLSALTGLWLWWPRNGAFFAGLRWNRGVRTTFNLHHQIGFWLCIPLAVLALTGVYISFPQSSRALTGLFVQTNAPEARGGGGGGPPPLTQTNLTIDAVASAALAAGPVGGELVSIALPTRAREGAPSWRVQVKAPGADLPATIAVDDETGEAKVRGERGGPSPGESVARLMRRIHDGADMGLFWQGVIFLGGWAPAILGYTAS
ncbi:MAG: PepSY-associated TM helix domain-containing protein [Terricaulis sp.]